MSRFKKIILWVGVVLSIFVVFWVLSPPSKGVVEVSSVPEPNAGMMAPDFSLPATDGSTVTLSSFRGKQNVLIYFSEGLTCDPCMQQMPELNRYKSEFNNLNVKVLYVTMDSIKDLKEAMPRYGITKPILSYLKAHTEVDYNLTQNSMGLARRAGHTFILVDKTGRILWRKEYWPGLGMNVPNGTMFVRGQDIVNQVTKYMEGKS